MAIDTERKRASLMGVLLPVPDGELDAFDMATLMGCYGGIPAQAPKTRGKWWLHPGLTDNWALKPERISDWQEAPEKPNYWS